MGSKWTVAPCRTCIRALATIRDRSLEAECGEFGLRIQVFTTHGLMARAAVIPVASSWTTARQRASSSRRSLRAIIFGADTTTDQKKGCLFRARLTERLSQT